MRLVEPAMLKEMGVNMSLFQEVSLIRNVLLTKVEAVAKEKKNQDLVRVTAATMRRKVLSIVRTIGTKMIWKNRCHKSPPEERLKLLMASLLSMEEFQESKV